MIISKSSLRNFFENHNRKNIVNSNELLMFDKNFPLEKLEKLRKKYNSKDIKTKR